MQPPIFLIPGLDGSGILFKPFIEVFPFPVTVIPYHTNTAERLARNAERRTEQSIDGLTEYVTQQILAKVDNNPVILIAESFGGVMTDRILQAGKVNVTKAIFLAGFLHRPSYWSALGRLTKPTKFSIASIKHVPDKLLDPALFWRFGSPELTQLFRDSLNTRVYVKHIELISKLTLNKQRQRIQTPTLYLQASHDSLVNKRCVDNFERSYANLTVKRIKASHFLVETNPEGASDAITKFINAL